MNILPDSIPYMKTPRERHVTIDPCGVFPYAGSRIRTRDQLFDDDDKEATAAARTSIIAPAQRSEKALDKAASKETPDGYVVCSVAKRGFGSGTLLYGRVIGGSKRREQSVSRRIMPLPGRSG